MKKDGLPEPIMDERDRSAINKLDLLCFILGAAAGFLVQYIQHGFS